MAIKLALVAIGHYLSKQKSSHQNDGFYHGKLGRLRAQKLGLALNNDKIISDEATLLALFLSIFGKPHKKYLIVHSFEFTRSSRLASLIAEQWITGELCSGRVNIATTKSNVFSQWLLNKSKRHGDNWWVESDGEHADLNVSHFMEAQAVRFILQCIIKIEYRYEQHFIERQAKEFKSVLDNSQEVKFNFSSLSTFAERHKKRATGVTSEILKGKMPNVLFYKISNFFKTKDIAVLSAVNKTTYQFSK
ncbi:MAG: hypothetical protein JSR33_09565 [Proteobacteria bacterium]|nr:hypothetical protein [Pseudomonadota bacterium]